MSSRMLTSVIVVAAIAAASTAHSPQTYQYQAIHARFHSRACQHLFDKIWQVRALAKSGIVDTV